MTVELLPKVLENIAHWLPTQGPIKEFVHHNTLHALQNRPFAEAVLRASRLYGSRAYLSLEEYQQLLQAGKIDESALLEVCQEYAADRDRAWLDRVDACPPQLGLARSGIRSRWLDRHQLPMDRHTHPVLFRLVGQFLDQGIAMWRMPHAHQPLFRAVMQLVSESWLPLEPLSDRGLADLRRLPPDQLICQILNRFVSNAEQAQRYLLEMCLAHPGWSGMIHMLEVQPGDLVLRRQVSLLDFCALELLLEFAWAVRTLGPDFGPLALADERLDPLPVETTYELKVSDNELRQRIWHEAYERSYTQGLLELVLSNRSEQKVVAKEVQAFFCIDDRECSLRRHLEAVDPSVQTFGSAGFFGVDCVFQGVDDAFPFKHCPVPVNPKHLIRERGQGSAKGRSHESHSVNNGLVRGFLISQTLGLWASVRLALSIFRPSLGPLTTTSLRRVEPAANLQVERDENYPTDGGFQAGYSLDEMADRVHGQLRATGALMEGLSDLVVFFGHGASSVNNPYFAAYDCGACSGKPGAPNARAFALMANHPQVRARLAERQVAIPDTCWFVGGLHDTTRDEVQYYDLESMPAVLRPRFQQFRESVETALGRNAQERCQKFARLPGKLNARQAREEVCRRSTAIFETRPELNHATNAACIVGPRTLSRGVNLQRRSFLNSYNPANDPSGDILAGILSAVVPVCGGINLEYFFSRVDPQVYGAGTKLPHNVNGLIGVMNGTEGDLLTGLPTQMTELHEPVRLTMLVQQEPEVALSAVQRNPSVYEWVENGWMFYYSISPTTQEIYQFRHGGMVRHQARPSPATGPARWGSVPSIPLATAVPQGV